MIDLKTERVLSFAEACRHLPRRRASRPAHPGTLYRWAAKGLRGVHLETIQVGGTQCTSLEALQRFFERLEAAAPSSRSIDREARP
jgi:hypothetical protein